MRDTVTPVPGDLVITEVMPSPSSVSDAVGEWFEARATRDVDLNGLGLDRAGDTTANPNRDPVADCLHVTAGTHVVFARNADPVMNGGLPTPAAARSRFSLVAGTTTAPGDVQILSGADRDRRGHVDELAHRASRSARSGLHERHRQRRRRQLLRRRHELRHVRHRRPISARPAPPNAQCALAPPPGMCLDNGTLRAIVKPTAGQLVITEFLANPAGTGTDAAQEWFEIANIGNASFDLNGLGLKGSATHGERDRRRGVQARRRRRLRAVRPRHRPGAERRAARRRRDVLVRARAAATAASACSTARRCSTRSRGRRSIQEGASKQLQPVETSTTAATTTRRTSATPTVADLRRPRGTSGRRRRSNACP